MYLMAYGLKSIAYLMHVPSFITFLKSKAVLIHNYQKKNLYQVLRTVSSNIMNRTNIYIL